MSSRVLSFLVGCLHSYQTGRSHQPFRIGRHLKADSFAVTYYRADPQLYVVQMCYSGRNPKKMRIVWLQDVRRRTPAGATKTCRNASCLGQE